MAGLLRHRRITFCVQLFKRMTESTIYTGCGVSIEQRSRFGSKNPKQNLPEFVLFSKSSGCSLCVVAKKMLEQYSAKISLKEIDISLPENQTWFDKYKYDIPVLHLDGRLLMKHGINTKHLEHSIEEWYKEKKL